MQLRCLCREMTRDLRIEPAMNLRTQLKNFDDSHGSRPFDQAPPLNRLGADVMLRPEGPLSALHLVFF
jgi:hypothetical protein